MIQRYFPGAAAVHMSLIKMEKAITKVEQKGLVREGGWRNMSRLFRNSYPGPSRKRCCLDDVWGWKVRLIQCNER